MVKRLLQVEGICLTAVLFSLLINIQFVRADGSKDMYPADYFERYAAAGVTTSNAGSYRACLLSGIPTGSDPNLASPFPTNGTLKVYAKEGEHIYMASSAMVMKNNTTKESYGRIVWRAPDGTTGRVENVRRGGLIANRTEELAGPNINGSTSGYDAYKLTVGAGQEGVWEIDFIGTTTTMNFSQETPSRHKINDWVEDVNRPYINAFDVSVSNEDDDAFIKGRVYANVLNLMMPSVYNNNDFSCQWYSTFYVLTNTGYLYEVKPNGQNGHFSTFFANNKGVQTNPVGWINDNSAYSSSLAVSCYGGFASYKSLDCDVSSNNRFRDSKVPTYDPRRPDMALTRVVDGEEKTVDDITHKIFFCIPSSDMPAYAPAVYGSTVDSTWLLTNLNAENAPLISNLSLVGKESRLPGVLGPEGVDIFFEANASGDYLIEMVFGAGYANRILSGYCEKGENVIDWDGLDGNGKRVPVVNVSLAGKLKSAEIHFPFFDLENNKNGLILNQLNAEWTAVERDTIYWDDSSLSGVGSLVSGEDPLQMTAGTTSPGHRWIYNRGSNRGDKRIIDTWTFAQGASRGTQNLSAYSRYIDLGITSVVADTTVAHVGEVVSYTLEVVNKAGGKMEYNGDSVIVDSDADSASVGVWFPRGGFVTTSVELLDSDDSTCRVARQPSSSEFGLGFISLKNGKRATLRVSGYATSSLAHNYIQPIGFIMRPGDFFEVDAKNLASDGMPLNPLNEYEGIVNDNVMMVDVPIFLLNSAPVSVANDTVVRAGRSVTGNVLNNDADVDGDALAVTGVMVDGTVGSLGDPVTIKKDGLACGTFVLNADGSYTFTADGSFGGGVPNIYYSITDGFTGNLTFTGEDLIPGVDTSRVNIQVLPNHLPTVTPTSVSINKSGNRTWVPILVSDEDGDPLTLSLSGDDASSFEVSGDSVFYIGSAVASETVAHFDLTVDDGVRTPVVTPISVTIRVNQTPTISPDTVSIYAMYNTAKKYMLPVVLSDPDGDDVTIKGIFGDSKSYFSHTNDKIYFEGTAGSMGNTRRTGVWPYEVFVSLEDDRGATVSLPLVVKVNVTRDSVAESAPYVYADDAAYYGDSLFEVLTYGANCEGTWSINDSVLGLIDTNAVLPAGNHTLDMMFTPTSGLYQTASVVVRFTILPRPITLGSGSAEKVYDGDVLSEQTVSVISGSLVGTESFIYSNFANLISADTIENTFSYAPASGTSLSNYNISVQNGSLIVQPRPITLTSATATKIFDGTPLSQPTVTVSSGSFVGVDEFVYSNFASITGVGTVENTFNYAPAPGVTLSNYDVTVEYGELTVAPFVWTGDYDIVLANTSYLYDGSEHQPACTIKVGDDVVDEMFYKLQYVDNIDAGDSAKVIVSPKENSGVVFDPDSAYFSITKRSVVIKSSSCEQEYDGSVFTCHSIESVTGDGMAAGESFTPEYTASLQNVGSVDNVFSVDINTRNYDVTLEYGSLTVSPKVVTLSEANVTLSDTSFVYDGEEHCPTVSIVVDGIVMEPDRDYTVECANNVRVGNHTAVASVKKVTGGNFDFSDYDALFSIEPAVIRIADRSVASKTYDGSNVATVTLNGFSGAVPGEDVDVEVSALFADANAGTDKNVEISYALKGQDKDNYRLDMERETYANGEISPLEVVLSWNSGPAFLYDGTLKRVDASVTNAVGTDQVNVLSYENNEATAIGDYMAKALSLDDNNYKLPDDATYNWSIQPDLVKADMTLENVPYTYDQTTHEPGVTVKVGDVVLTDADYSVSYENNVDAGDSAMAIVSRKMGSIYFFDTDTLYFSIAKRTVKFRSDSCWKVYSGTPLTCETASAVDPSDILPGDTYTVTFTGYQTNVGVSDNTFVVTFDKDNYIVEYLYGGLTVEPMAIEITPSDISWNDTVFVYDGQPHCPTAVITVDGRVLDPTSDYKILCTNNVKVGNDVAHIAVRSMDGGNFIFTDYEVNFSIEPVVISITDSTVFEKTYDGGTSATVVVNDVSFKAPGDSIMVTTSAKFNNGSAGTYKTVSINYALVGPDSENYRLAYDRAVYTEGVINPREVELVWSVPDTFVYDGQKHGVSAQVVTSLHVSSPGVVKGYVNDSASAAGVYVARARGVSNRNFKLPENDSLVWVILPKALDSSAFKLQESYVTYDAMPHPATFVPDSSLQFVEGVDYSIYYRYMGSEGASIWTGFSPTNAGVYEIKVVVHSPNYEENELTGWQMVIGRAPVTVVPSVTQSKVYDRLADAAVSVESVSGVFSGEDVKVSAVAQYDTFTTSASSIRVTYHIEGEDTANYFLQNTFFLTDGVILPLELTVEGTTVLDKSYDGNANAVVAIGTLPSVISPDEVVVSASSALFASDTIGNGTDVFVTYRLSGRDAANYTVKPDTIKGNILEPPVSFAWSVKDTVYGEAIVGLNPKVEVEHTLDGNLTYFVDGLPVDTGYIIPAGTHTLLAQFSGEGGFSIPSGGNSIRVSKKYLVLDAYDINPSKVYDATDSVLSLSTDSLLVGLVGQDDVRLSSLTARYENAQVGSNKDIVVNFSLEGADTSNYRIEEEHLRGEIKVREVKLAAGDSTKVYDGTPLVYDSVTIIGDGFIEGDLLSVHATGMIVEPGHVLNKVVFQFANDSVENNYFILLARGFLVITKIPQEAPVLTAVDESISGFNDGRILGLTTSMEMRGENDSIFTMVSREDSLYAPGTYYVRFPELQYYDASDVTEVVINPGPGEFVVEVSSSDTTRGVAGGSGTYLYGSQVTVEAVAQTGYHFVAWNDTITENPFSFVLTGDTSFVASFAPNSYMLYALDGGVTVDSLSALFGDTVTESMLRVTLFKEGYDFQGWSPSFPIVMGASDVSVEALWKQQMFLVDVDSLTERGKVFVDFENPVAYGDTISLTAVPSEGYHFTAWSNGVTANPYKVVVKSDTSFGALYEPNNHVLYVISDGITLDTFPVVFGDTVREDMLNVPDAKAGHLFSGWSPALPVTVGDSDMTVVAQWTRLSYIVSVDTSTVGGRATTDFENPVFYEDTVMLTAQAAEGYHFLSWNDGEAANPRSVVVTSDTSFSPLFGVNTHMLYIVSDDEVKDSFSIAYGDTITDSLLTLSLEKVGHDFAGWLPEPPIVAGDSDMTVEAQWTKRMYIVTIDTTTDKGSFINDFENPVAYGSFVTTEAVPATGYHFVSWTDGVATNPRKCYVYRDTFFSAIFEPNQYMFYVLSEGDTLRSVPVLYGDTVSDSLVDSTPEKVGYDFVGWSPELPLVVDTADVTIVAQFTKKNFIFTIDTLYENGGVSVDFENPVAYGDTVTLTAEPSEGYHFVAWNDSVQTNPRQVVVVSDTSLTPLFEVNLYNLTILSDGDTLKRIMVPYGDSIIESSLDVSPEKVGHDFVGWQPELPLVMGAADLTIEAQFQRKTFELNLDTLLEHGTILTDFENPVSYGDAITLEAVPSEGYHFVAWNDSVTTNPRKIVVVGDTSLTPIFAANLYYLIVMNEDTIVETLPVHYGDTIQESFVAVTLEKVGHDFAGWLPSLPVTVGTGDVTIVAQWTKKTLELTIDTLFENGRIILGFENPVTYGDTITLTAEPFEGFHFFSWADGDSLNPRSIVVVSDTSLEPVFVPNTYVFSALVDGDTLLKFKAVYGDSITDSLLNVIPEKVGHDFAGWYPTLPIKVGAEDLSVEAQWTRKTYRVVVEAGENGNVDLKFENPVAYGDSIEFLAIADEGFRFNSWNDGDRSNPRKVKVTSDSSFAASFSPSVYYLTVISDNDTLATLPFHFRDSVMRQKVDSLQPVKVGHNFVDWNVEFPLAMGSHDTSVTAIFTPKIFSVITKVNGNVGKVTGEGEYPYGSLVNLQAIPNAGFHFVSWGDGDTARAINFFISSDTIVSTLFAKDIDEMMVDTLIIPAFGYCPNTEDVIRYSLLNSEAPSEYKIVFSEEAKAVGFVDVDFTKIDADNEVKIVIPDCPADVYRASIQFKNKINSVTPFFDIDLRVNLSNDYILDIWQDVVSVVNTENIFREYQWYHDDVKVGGATLPYYCEKKGLSGSYYLEAVTTDGRQLRTCKKWFDNATNTTLSVYPNPTSEKATVELSVDNGATHSLTVTNALGVVVLNSSFVGRKTQIDFRSLAPGAYIVEVDGLTVKEIRK
ncbi:MAG: InlB B-repeat-containing protein [Paludibacteraceae bacterium]|nr:InlB B-repeat-containing protein [Paludibacteraceae bacterium]